MSLISRALRVDRGEGRITAYLVAVMFASMAGSAIGESGIQAMFFSRFGTDPLPLMYLAQAVTTLIAMFALTAVLDRLAHRLIYIVSPALLVAILLVERAVVLTDAGWIYPVLWVTVAFATLAQAIGLWGVAGSVVDTRQAKRLFPIFGAGGILGSVAGGLLTRPLAAALGAPNLLFVWAAALAVAGLLTRLVLGPVPPPLAGTRRHRSSALGDLRRGLGIVRRSRLLMAMAVSAVLFSVLFYSLFLPFASAAAARYPDAGQLAGFLGLVWAVVTGTAFVASILLTNRLFVWFGVAAMVLVLPLLYTGAFAVLIVTTAFSAIVSLRIVTGVWLQGVASPAWETLVNIVPAERRDQTRAFLNGGPAQVGTAIAGVVALVGQDVLTAREFAAIGLVASLLTLVAALAIRRSYTDALVEAMRTGRPQVFDTAAAWTPMPLELDAEGRRVLAASMRSDDLRLRRLAFQLAAREGNADPGAILRGADDPDPAVRLATVGALDPSEGAEREALGRLMEDADVEVAAAAAGRSLASAGPEALDRLRRLLRDGDPEVRRAALGGLALAPDEIAADLAAGLLADPDPEVRAAALARIAVVPERALGPSVAAISDPDPVVRRAAGRTLGACGPAAVEHVLNALADPGMIEPGIEAARRLRAVGHEGAVRDFARITGRQVRDDAALLGSLSGNDDAERLLRDAILERCRRVARSGLWALTTVAREPTAMAVAIDHLDGRSEQVPEALETLEASSRDRADVRPLLEPWEPIRVQDGTGRLPLDDEDDTIRRCAELVRLRREGGTMTTASSLPALERVLVLRRVSLFEALAPGDLEKVAEIAEERGYADGETLAVEGELGDELHIVTGGTIRVVQLRGGAEHELARRTAGEVVGEMSLLTRAPRVASLIADGPVRTLRIGDRAFASMLRERPSVALELLRVLAQRLSDATPATDD